MRSLWPIGLLLTIGMLGGGALGCGGEQDQDDPQAELQQLSKGSKKKKCVAFDWQTGKTKVVKCPEPDVCTIVYPDSTTVDVPCSGSPTADTSTAGGYDTNSPMR